LFINSCLSSLHLLPGFRSSERCPQLGLQAFAFLSCSVGPWCRRIGCMRQSFRQSPSCDKLDFPADESVAGLPLRTLSNMRCLCSIADHPRDLTVVHPLALLEIARNPQRAASRFHHLAHQCFEGNARRPTEPGPRLGGIAELFRGILQGNPSHGAMNLITFRKKKLRKIRSICPVIPVISARRPINA